MNGIVKAFQWLIFVIIIPFFVFIVVAGTVAHFSGVDVIEKTKKVTQAINGVEEIERIHTLLNKTKDALEEKITAEEKLEKTIETKDKEIESYKEEIKTLKDQLKTSKNHQKLQEDVIKSYENMSPANAAAILSESEEEEAIRILRGIKSTKLAQILENMEPSLAAKLTKGITE